MHARPSPDKSDDDHMQDEAEGSNAFKGLIEQEPTPRSPGVVSKQASMFPSLFLG